MSEDDRHLRDLFEPPSEVRGRVARVALATPPRRYRLWLRLAAPVVGGIAAMVAIVGLLSDGRQRTTKAERPRAALRITNENDVVTVVSASGEARLLAARTRPNGRGGGIIIHLGDRDED